jgi:dTDP-4-amino-4,6-dideoxygalactose transaminase
LTLPLYPELTTDMINQVIYGLKETLQ